MHTIRKKVTKEVSDKKEKKFYWLKLKENFFEEPSIDWLLDQPKGKEYVAIYLMLCLRTINTQGTLIRKIGDLIIPYDLKKIAQITRTDIDTIIVAFELFKKLNLVSILDNDTFFIQQVEEMVGTSETKWAEYKRNQRLTNKNKQELNLDNVQNMSNETEDTPLDNVPLDSRDKILEFRDKEIKDSNSNNLNDDNENHPSVIVTNPEEAIQNIILSWNAIKTIPKIQTVSQQTRRYLDLIHILKQYGTEKVIQAINNIPKSQYLQGKNDKGIIIQFDWFINQDNFIKVLENRYKDSSKSNPNNKFTNMYSHEWDFDEIERLEAEHIEQKVKELRGVGTY